MTDELERRLSSVLARVAEQADDAAGRLRNPAAFPPPRQTRPAAGRLRTVWVAGAAALAVAGVTAGVVLAAPRLGAQEPARPAPSEPAGARVGTADGVHPLWPLTLSERPTRTFAELPVATSVPVPVPHVDGQKRRPTLVTAAGTISFPQPDATSVMLLAQRERGLFVVLNGAPPRGEQEGIWNARFVLVSPDNGVRVIHRAAAARHVEVSPDGRLLAVDTGQAVELVDVTSGTVVHRLPRTFAGLMWASDDVLVLGGQGAGTPSFLWRAPWTGPAERTSRRTTGDRVVDGTRVALDGASGCLQRVTADGTVTSANCHGWQSGGGISPDGRYLPLEWRPAGGGGVGRGVLDLTTNEVTTWPLAGTSPWASWLGPFDVLLVSDVPDAEERAWCRLGTGLCSRVPEAVATRAWEGKDWFGR